MKLANAVSRRKSTEARKFVSEEAVIKFSVFLSIAKDNTEAAIDTDPPVPLTTFHYFAQSTAAHSPPGYFALSHTVDNAGAPEVTERFINLSLNYLYRKSSAEVKKFNSGKLVEKITYL